MIKVKTFAVNPLREATYLVYDEQTMDAVVIDCGISTLKECERFDEFVAKNEIKIVKLINTHCHVDHVAGVGYLKNKYNVPFAASKKDEVMLEMFPQMASMYQIEVPEPAIKAIDEDLKDGDCVEFGNSKLRVIATPGHSLGGLVFYNEEQDILFTGDTLFKGSIGRSDLPGGDYAELMNSILNKIVKLEKNMTIYPGHGDHTTLSHEVMYNPFITDVLKGEVNY